jgi:hypothetical protein
MITNSKTGEIESNDRRKNSWSTPALIRIEASEAEISTRGTGDGTFTTS